MDATANDVPEEIQGFPTIKLFPAGAKDSPIDYSGARTVEDLAKFIKESGKHGVDAMVAVAEDDGEDDMPESDELGKAAPAATAVSEGASAVSEGVKESVKSMAGDAAEAIKIAIVDSDGDRADHDEL